MYNAWDYLVQIKSNEILILIFIAALQCFFEREERAKRRKYKEMIGYDCASIEFLNFFANINENCCCWLVLQNGRVVYNSTRAKLV